VTTLILDATSLICWADELCDDILFRELQTLGYNFIIPQRVISEVKFDTLEDPQIAMSVKKNAEIRDAPDKMYQELSNRYLGLGPGELSVISIAKKLDSNIEFYCILDDKSARNACKRLDIDKKGQIGLVAELVKEDRINKTKGTQILEEMKQGGTILPENHIELLGNNI
jgi:predicted nucleic acid-binding protein